MKQAFKIYLESVGIVGVLLDRVDVIITFLESISLQEIADIFISEYVKEDGSREYESLYLFSINFVMEAKQFIQKDDFDLLPVAGRITYWRLQKSDYDFVKGTDKSRLLVHFDTGEMGVSADLKASRENCDHLRDILKNRIMPHIEH